MNPEPIILGPPAKPEGMQERLWLSTNRASRVRDPNVFEPRPKGKTLEGQTLGKMGNLGFCNRIPNGIEMLSPLRKRRFQMLALIECIHHQKMGGEPPISQTWLVIGKGSGRIPLPIMPPRSGRLNTNLVSQMHWNSRKDEIKSRAI